MRKSNLTQLKANASVKKAYFSYLISSFWRRPIGYVIPLIYILFLAIILIIVPKIMKNSALFIWNITSFNVPIFTLFFVAASCAALAVTIFRISHEDGTELSISAKPLTKGAMVGFKVLVYLIVTLAITALAVIVAVLIKPIFGAYSTTNKHGIKPEQYKGIILSMLVGNLVNLFLFSGISVLVSMLGGQVITMITSIGVAFIMVMLNFIYGYVVKTPNDIITDEYNTSINCVSTFTRKQYDEQGENLKPQRFTSIQCYVNDEGEELHHYDTYEYWLKAEKQAKNSFVAYVDFGKQLSSLCASFGLEGTQLSDVAKLPIGSDTAYKYKIDEKSHITNKENIDEGNYPIGVFNWQEYQGKYYPCVTTLGPGLSGVISDWYLSSSVYGLEFNSVATISRSQWGFWYPGKKIAAQIPGDLTLDINDAYLTPDQLTEAASICESFITPWNWESGNWFVNHLTTSTTGIWEGNYKDLDLLDKFKTNTKLQVYFMVYGQESENKMIKDYLDTTYPEEGEHSFPYTTAQVVDTYLNNSNFRRITNMISYSSWYGFYIGTIDDMNLYSTLVSTEIPYCESYNNFYTYTVERLYSTTALTAIWASVAVALFAVAIIVYKKTDFK